jgi:hypothetical protein
LIIVWLRRSTMTVFRKRPVLIDHILVSRELLFAQRQVDSIVAAIESIAESTQRRRDATFPDHAALFARFELGA